MLKKLFEMGRIYPCTKTRKEIRSAGMLDSFGLEFLYPESFRPLDADDSDQEFRFDIKKFEKFEKKIIYIQVNDLPDGDDPFKRENFQRNSITRGLSNSSDEDLIIISDLDEIPACSSDASYAAMTTHGRARLLENSNSLLNASYICSRGGFEVGQVVHAAPQVCLVQRFLTLGGRFLGAQRS